jgi:hypothetical protein
VAIAALLALCAPAAAQPTATFISGQASGSPDGIGFRRSDGVRINTFFNGSTPAFGKYSGSGDTSGGLVDGAILVATFRASFEARIMSLPGRGVRVTYDTVEDGRFLEPEDYLGEVGGFLDYCCGGPNAPVVQVEGGPARLRITGTGRGAMSQYHSISGPGGITIQSGGIAPPGTYYLPFWSVSARVRDQSPLWHREDSLIIDLVTPCAGDFNRDTEVNSQDFFDFVAAFFAGEPAADFNGNGTVNSQDFFDFLAAFFAGCG